MANILGEIVKSGRGHNLLYEGYALRKDRRYEEKQHWRCTVVGCPGRAHTDFSDPPVILQSVTQLGHAFKRSTMHRRRYRYVWHKMCGVLSIAILKRVKLPRVRLTRAKLGKRAKLSRAKLASRRSGTRPTGPRQTRTRQKGRAKLE